MTPARTLMHHLAAAAALTPPDASETQWFVSIGAAAAADDPHDVDRASSATPPGNDRTDPDVQDVQDVQDAQDAPSITLVMEDAGDILLLSATLGTALRAHPATFWRYLLGLNAGLLAADHGAVTIDPPGHTIALSLAIDGATSGLDAVVPRFDAFVAQARHLIDVLNDELPLDPAQARETGNDAGDAPNSPLFILPV